MNRAFSTFTKGVAAGIAVGTAVSMISKPLDIRKRARMKKNATRALRAVSDVLQNAQSMIR